MNRRYGLFILGGTLLGVATGWVCNQFLDPPTAASVAGYLGLITDIFLRLIKMVIAPLVFTTLVAGIARMENAAAIGRIGAKTMAWFIGASLLSLTIGLVMVHLIAPGVGLALPLPSGTAQSAVTASTFTLHDFIGHVVPTSIFAALANNEILQIVVFALFVGTAVASLDGRAPAVLTLVEQAAAIMLKVTQFVMAVAPFAIFAALSATVAQQGPSVLVVYAKFIGGFYLSIGILWALLIGACFFFVGRRVGPFMAAIREPVLIGLATASSEAAYPKTLTALEQFGIPPAIVRFALPLGYSFNLDGSMMYCAFATIFIAQAYGIDLSLGQQVVMLLFLMVTSKGMAGVPRASLVVIAATLTFFHLPEASLALILGVDHLLDMGRTATNVVGNSVACVAVARWERRQPQTASA